MDGTAQFSNSGQEFEIRSHVLVRRCGGFASAEQDLHDGEWTDWQRAQVLHVCLDGGQKWVLLARKPNQSAIEGLDLYTEDD